MCGIETTPEYFERIAKDEELIRIATKKIRKFGRHSDDRVWELPSNV